jgi:hypothetical protein
MACSQRERRVQEWAVVWVVARLLACRRGITSVEMAIVTPMLIALVLGVIEFALLLFTFSSMQTAARDVGRQIAVNFLAEGQAGAAVRDRLPGWSRDAVDVGVERTAPGNPSEDMILVTVSMQARDATPLRFFTIMSGPWSIETQVAMKQELPL